MQNTPRKCKEYFIKKILLEAGWSENVLLKVSELGVIVSITESNSESNTESLTNINSADVINGVVIPGMSNVHSHAFQSAFSGFTECRSELQNSSFDHHTEHDNFWTWRAMMYKFVDRITPEQQHIIAKQLYIDCLKAGYTSIGEFHYLHHNNNGIRYEDPAETSHQLINAALETGIAMTHLPVYYRRAGFDDTSSAHLNEHQLRFKHSPDDYFQLISILNEQYVDQSRINIGIAPHSLRAVSVNDINDAVNYLSGYNSSAPIHIHIAEQGSEVEQCLAFNHQRPVQHLFDHCDVDERWCLVHATHVNEQEIWEMESRNVTAGLCLTTEANLGDGVFPASHYVEQGGQFCIGSDSHVSVSPFEELRLLEYGQRLTLQQRNVLCGTHSVGRFLYQNAALNGARALNRNSGVLAVGHNADWLVLDEENPALYSKNNDQILDSAIFSSRMNPVKDVMVQGKWVIKDSHHLNEESVRRQYKAVIETLTNE